ncbi:tyrosine-type recombinase/integrase [Microbacterium sp. TPU 3598]|uniref:tyrosine-type recombinase/integrase n=1 Tax=Microbacterium sp. TPU 3598 TaxID=1938334 RepID=UPI000BBAC34A|nr:tyrosine-type recombinase/integrase [Microbacterium sp. TPU 3598]
MALPLSASWTEALDDYALKLRGDSRTPATIRARREQLQHLARRIGVGPWEVSADALLAFVGSQEWMQETRRNRYACFREFWKWAKRTKRIDRNPAKHLPRVSASAPNPDPVPEQVYADAMKRSDERTRLIMRLAHDAGLRRGEIALIHSEDLRPDLLGWSLLVHGKGRKLRIIPLTPRLALDLRALPEGYAFPGAIDGHLSPRRVYELVDEVLPGPWSLHNLRHSFATNAHEASGGDVLTLRNLMGHASADTTGRYVRLSDARGRSVVYAAAGLAAPDKPTARLVAV